MSHMLVSKRSNVTPLAEGVTFLPSTKRAAGKQARWVRGSILLLITYVATLGGCACGKYHLRCSNMLLRARFNTASSILSDR